MPRVRFSYNPSPRMVVWGGFGSTTYMEGTGANLRLTINPPYQTSILYTASAPSANDPGTSTTAATAFATNNTACATTTNPACSLLFRAWDPKLRPSTVSEYSLTAEYQLTNSASFQIGYVGEHAYHLIQATNGNQLAAPCTANGALIAYNSAACFCGKQSTVLPDGRAERLCAHHNDARYGELQRVAGWRVAVAGFVYSGFPTTISSGNINSGVNSSQQRAVRYRKLNAVNRTTVNWFGTDASAAPCLTAGLDNGSCAYGQPVSGIISPQRPGTERTPGYQQYDASLFKDFHITESQRFTLRVDGSNIFNIASYGNPVRDITSSTFGRITTTRSGPRQLQLSAKYNF